MGTSLLGHLGGRGGGRLAGGCCLGRSSAFFQNALSKDSASPKLTQTHTHTHFVQVSTGQPSQRPLVLQQPAARKATHHEEPSQKALARTPEALRLPGSGLSSPADVKAATESATSVTVLLLAISPFLTSDGPAAW